jgi:hypothetical protein
MFEEFELHHREPVEQQTFDFKVGDAVNSYRGLGKIVSISGDFAKVQLHNSKQTIATVPLSSLKKVEAE